MQYSNYTSKILDAQYSVSKSKQIIMLYDGVIKIISQAIEAGEKQDLQTRYNLLSKAAMIVNGLQDSLDHNAGEEIANILDNYYLSIYTKIMNAQSQKDPTLLEQVLVELTSMRDSWREVDEALSVQQADEAGSSINSDYDESGTGIEI